MGRWAATPQPPKRSRYGNGRGAQTCSPALTGISVQLKMASVRGETTTLSQDSRSLACRTSPRLAPTGDRFVDGAASVQPARPRASPVECDRPAASAATVHLGERERGGGSVRWLGRPDRVRSEASTQRLRRRAVSATAGRPPASAIAPERSSWSPAPRVLVLLRPRSVSRAVAYAPKDG